MSLQALADTYEDLGFITHPTAILSPALIEDAANGLFDVRDGKYDPGTQPAPSPWTPGDDPKKLVKIEQPHDASEALRQAICHPALGESIARIIGADFIQVWHVQGLIKPSVQGDDCGPQVGWHQDMQYWRTAWDADSDLFTAWLALSDVTLDSGPVLFVPGSHRWGLLPGGDFFSQDQAAIKRAIEAHIPEGESWDQTAGPLSPGGLSLHDRLTIHGSTANTSGRPRLSLAIHLCTDHATVDRDHEWGMHIDDFNRCPVIWDAK